MLIHRPLFAAVLVAVLASADPAASDSLESAGADLCEKVKTCALAEIDKAISGRQYRFRGGMCKCHGMVEMYLTRAKILDKLGRDREATEQRAKAKQETLPHAKWAAGNAFRIGVPVGVYYDWLKRIRLAQQEREQESVRP